MADNIIATSTSNPNFYAQKTAMLGNAIGTFVGAYQERKARQQAQEDAEITNAMKLLQQYPEMADTLGASLAARYGDKHPELGGLVDVIRQRRTLADEIPAAGRALEGREKSLWGDYQGKQQQLAEMPDFNTVNVPFDTAYGSILAGSGTTAPPRPPLRSAGGGESPMMALGPYMSQPPTPPLKAAQNVEMMVPNHEKAALGQQLSQVNPEMFTTQALHEMDPAQRRRAAVYLKAMGIETPDVGVLDQMKLLPEGVRAQMMLKLGMLPKDPDVEKVVRTYNKLEPTPVALQQQSFERDTQEQGHQNRLDESANTDALARQRFAYEDGLRAAAEQRRLGNQKEVIDYRASKRTDSSDEEDGVSWKTIVKDSQTATRDWDARNRAALIGLQGKLRKEAIDKFDQEVGKRPVPVPEIVARQISARIKDLGLTGEDASETAIQATTAYMAARRNKATLSDASKTALGQVVGSEQLAAAAAAREAKMAQMQAAQATAAGQAVAGDETAPASPPAAKPQAKPAAPAAAGSRAIQGDSRAIQGRVNQSAGAAPAPPMNAKKVYSPEEAAIAAKVKQMRPDATDAEVDRVVQHASQEKAAIDAKAPRDWRKMSTEEKRKYGGYIEYLGSLYLAAGVRPN